MKINPNNFKNIIFDFGGVIINLDYTLTTKAFEELGVTDFDSFFSKAKQNRLFDSYEKGEVTSATLRKELKMQLHDFETDSTIDKAWNAMLLDLPKERLDLLKILNHTHNTFLLSNTNEIHINCFHNYLEENFNANNLNNYFNKVYFSYEIGMRKPDAEIFKFVLEENKLNPRETLFIDDSIQHIEGAKKLGIQTYWLDVKKETILDVLT